MKIRIGCFLVCFGLVVLLLNSPASADQKFKINTSPTDANVVANDKTGDALIYWEKDGSIFTAILKAKKKNPKKFKLGKTNQIKPKKGVYRRPYARFNSETGEYLLVCDNWPVDLPLSLAAGTGPEDNSIQPAAPKTSQIILIKIRTNGKKRGKAITAVKDREVNIKPVLLPLGDKDLKKFESSRFRIYYSKIPREIVSNQPVAPAAKKPGIWHVECDENGKCQKSAFLFDTALTEKATVADGTIARGYITIDNASRCSVVFPNDSGYYGNGGTATNTNVLWGDWFLVDGNQASSEGFAAVHIEGDDACALQHRQGTLFGGLIRQTHSPAIGCHPNGTLLTGLTGVDPFDDSQSGWFGASRFRCNQEGERVRDPDEPTRPNRVTGYTFYSRYTGMMDNREPLSPNSPSRKSSISADPVPLWIGLIVENGEALAAKFNGEARIIQKKVIFKHSGSVPEFALEHLDARDLGIFIWSEEIGGKKTSLDVLVTTLK